MYIFLLLLFFFSKCDNVCSGGNFMMLGVCNNNFLIFMNNTKYIDFFCYCIMFLCLLILFIIKSNVLIESRKRKLSKKLVITIGAVLITLFVGYFYFSVFNSRENCIFEYIQPKDVPAKDNFSEVAIKEIINNEIIIVGDSRMRFLADDSKVNTYKHISFIAKGGARFEWFNNEALKNLNKKLKNKKNNVQYHVVINMGVNDLNIGRGTYYVGKQYYNAYKKLALKYPDVKFYMLSINPVDDILYHKINHDSKVYNYKIINTNNQMRMLLEGDNINNLNYCNSYYSINFEIPDGIHYSSNTSQKVIDFIMNKCIIYS